MNSPEVRRNGKLQVPKCQQFFVPFWFLIRLAQSNGNFGILPCSMLLSSLPISGKNGKCETLNGISELKSTSQCRRRPCIRRQSFRRSAFHWGFIWEAVRFCPYAVLWILVCFSTVYSNRRPKPHLTSLETRYPQAIVSLAGKWFASGGPPAKNCWGCSL